MPELLVSRSDNYDTFRNDTDALMPEYVAAAAHTLRHMTEKDLRSYAQIHPDGFLKFQIGPADGVVSGQVRLHFWIPGRKGTEQPHSHPWHLASLVLAGTYREYQPTMQPQENGLKEFKVRYPVGRDERAGVEQVGSETYGCERGILLETTAGGTHYLSAGPTHMSSPDGLGGITLAVMSRRFRNEAHFYALDDTPYKDEVTDEDVAAVMGLIKSTRGDL